MYSQNSMITVKNEDIALRRPAAERKAGNAASTFQEGDANSGADDSAVLPEHGDDHERTKMHNLSQIDLKSRSTRGKSSPQRRPATHAQQHPNEAEKNVKEGNFMSSAKPAPALNVHGASQRANFTTFNNDQEDPEVTQNVILPDWSISAGLLGSASDLDASRLFRNSQENLTLNGNILAMRKFHQSQAIAAPTVNNAGIVHGILNQGGEAANMLPQLSIKRMVAYRGADKSNMYNV